MESFDSPGDSVARTGLCNASRDRLARNTVRPLDGRTDGRLLAHDLAVQLLGERESLVSRLFGVYAAALVEQANEVERGRERGLLDDLLLALGRHAAVLRPNNLRGG